MRLSVLCIRVRIFRCVFVCLNESLSAHARTRVYLCVHVSVRASARKRNVAKDFRMIKRRFSLITVDIVIVVVLVAVGRIAIIFVGI